MGQWGIAPTPSRLPSIACALHRHGGVALQRQGHVVSTACGAQQEEEAGTISAAIAGTVATSTCHSILSLHLGGSLEPLRSVA